jgi:hypothetical protein
VQVACRLDDERRVRNILPTARVLLPPNVNQGRTFWEEAIVPRLGVLAQEPAITKVVVSLDKLDAIPAPQTKLVRTPGKELVCSDMSVGRRGLALSHVSLTDDDERVAGPALLGMGM